MPLYVVKILQCFLFVDGWLTAFFLLVHFESSWIFLYSINLLLADHLSSYICFVNLFFLQASYSFISFHGDVFLCVSLCVCMWVIEWGLRVKEWGCAISSLYLWCIFEAFLCHPLSSQLKLFFFRNTSIVDFCLSSAVFVKSPFFVWVCKCLIYTRKKIIIIRVRVKLNDPSASII